jgi:uncharacterized caspase-like protein
LVTLAIGIADYEHMEPVAGASRAGVPGNDLCCTAIDSIEFDDAAREGCDCCASGSELSAQCASHAHKLLTDAQATKAAIHDAIVNWLDPLEGPETTVVIFMSGHGMPGPDDDGDEGGSGDDWDEFFVPYEVAPDGENWDAAMAIRDDELAQWLDALESQQVVLIIDSCFSGGIFDASAAQVRGLSFGQADPAAMTAAQWQSGFAQDVEGNGRVILTASAEDEPSWESGGLRHGVFTYFFLEALRTAGADLNGNGWISAQEAFQYLDGRVTDYVQLVIGDAQHPQIYDGVGSDVDLFRLPSQTADCPF